MLKYFKWFKRNSGKTRKSYNSETGHTRNTQSRKTTKSQTISRSNNSNGTIRETKTWRRPDGYWKRTVKTIGSKPSPIRKPKFIKAKPYKPPKLRKPKGVKMMKSRQSTYKGGFSFHWPEQVLTPEESAYYEQITTNRKRKVMWFFLGMPKKKENGSYDIGWPRIILSYLLKMPVSLIVFIYELITTVVGGVLFLMWELFILGLKLTIFGLIIWAIVALIA